MNIKPAHGSFFFSETFIEYANEPVNEKPRC